MTLQTFKTSEFNLAAFCICKGAVLKAIDKSQQRAVFELIIRVPPKELIDAFWSNTLVPINQFIASQAEVKKKLFSDNF